MNKNNYETIELLLKSEKLDVNSLFILKLLYLNKICRLIFL